ncbi:MAG: hypothetical protein ACK5PF_03340, partial [bacterium]
FSTSLEAIGLLDPFQVRGIVAGFWYQTKYDFLTLMARGAKGVADAWRTSIVTALEDKASKESPLEHKLVKFLMSDFVGAITELEAKKAELESQIKAASPKDAEAEDGEAAEAAVYESNMMRMRPKPGVVTSAMLFNLLKLPSSRAAVRSRAFLSNQASINRQGICSIELALPSWEEQLAIDARVKSLTDRLKQEIQALTKWRSEKAGLVDDLLTGRIRVTPLWADAERVKECV